MNSAAGSLVHVNANGDSAAMAVRLLARLDELTDVLTARIRSGDPAYTEATLLTAEQFRESVRANLEAVLAQLAGMESRRLHAATAAGRLKAARGVPLVALLHAYRLLGRSIWEFVLTEADKDSREHLADMASQIWTIVDDFSEVATDAYERYLAEQTKRDGEMRRSMLRSLLDGGDGAQVWAAARALALPQIGLFVVVAAEASGRGDPPLSGIEERLRRQFVDSIWLAQPDTQIGLVCLTRRQSVDLVLRVLGDTASGRVGVSRTFTLLTDASGALREARSAASSADAGTVAVMSYDPSEIRVLLARSPGPASDFAHAVLDPVLTLPDAAERTSLLDTLWTWFECDGSSSAAASRLHFHRNTIHHRLRRIELLTGRRCSSPAAAAELYVALCAVRVGQQLSRTDDA